MKYRGVRSLPNSVSTWLEQRLGEQGIDSAVYSKYIVNLLQHQHAQLPHILKCGRARKVKSWQDFDPEELKRSVVTKCLSAASDQACGIESLVDELCIKLKEVESEGSNCLKEKISNSAKGKLASTPSSPDSAYKYQRGLVGPLEVGGLGRSPKAWRRKDKENTPATRIRSRSMGKQGGGGGRGGAKSLERGRGGRRAQEEAARMEELCELPVDFQQLLRSPEERSRPRKAKRGHSPLPNFIQCGTNILTSIWSSDSLRTQTSDSAWAAHLPPWADVEGTSLALGEEGGGFFSSLGGGGLNHTKDSGFTSVVPGARARGEGGGGERAKAAAAAEAEAPAPGAEEEEDLLTSMKTHFRPIRSEGRGTVQPPPAASYVDGTTFLVSASLEELHFTRSSSGALYLGSAQPTKYMEYRPSGDHTHFVPKFRVCQSEKFCQTEDEEGECEGEEEEGWLEEESGGGGTQEEEGFFFPGDGRLAQEATQAPAPTEVRGWLTAWPLSHIWSNSPVANSKPWSALPPAIGVLEGRGGEGGGGEHCLQLRHELTEEGEALLSDLSSIHLFLDADTPPNSQAHYPKRMRIRPCPFRSGFDSYM